MAESPTEFVIRDGLTAMDFARIHTWLSQTYWTPGIERELVEQAARNSSLVIGAFDNAGRQIGYARVVSDKTRFAYLCDVVVDPDYRGQGIGRQMVRFLIDHPDFASVGVWTLATRDAHGVYAPLGFLPITDPQSRPENWMVFRRTQPTW